MTIFLKAQLILRSFLYRLLAIQTFTNLFGYTKYLNLNLNLVSYDVPDLI